MVSSKLFEPLQIGRVKLNHRIVMAPLTRFRASDSHVHTQLATTYYEQRASVPGTLLITEATFIAPRAAGYANVPGLWSQEQLAAWKEVTDAVHAKGSFIFAQLWALGRAADPHQLEKESFGDLVGPSDISIQGRSAPRSLTDKEIWEYVDLYATAAKNAVEVAGFNSVEIHGANRYLIDQFIQDVSNKRTDSWGGSIENRARFALEVTKAVTKVVGSDQVGIRLSPYSTFQDMKMKDPIPQFTYVIKGLRDIGLAYLHLVESRVSGDRDGSGSESLKFAFDAWDKRSPVLVAGGFRPDTALKAIDGAYSSSDVAIVFGRYFISNPDLPYRIKNGIELMEYNRKTFYIPKSKTGYIDYPFSKDWLAESSKL